MIMINSSYRKIKGVFYTMAQKNRLKYIILGLLIDRPQTGYDLTKSFDSDIGEFWSANHSQIYPLLNRMETDNLLQHDQLRVGEKLVKKRYSVTNAGQQDFFLWLQEPSPLDNSHDEFLLKLYFVKDQHSDLLRTMVTEQLILHQEKLDNLNAQLADKFPTNQQRTQSYGHYQLLRHAILRERDYVAWLGEI